MRGVPIVVEEWVAVEGTRENPCVREDTGRVRYIHPSTVEDRGGTRCVKIARVVGFGTPCPPREP